MDFFDHANTHSSSKSVLESETSRAPNVNLAIVIRKLEGESMKISMLSCHETIEQCTFIQE